MRRRLEALVAGVLGANFAVTQIGCLPQAAGPEDQIVPEIVDAQIVPAQPSVDDLLTLVVHADDTDVLSDELIAEVTFAGDSLSEPMTYEIPFHSKNAIGDGENATTSRFTFALDGLPASLLGAGTYTATFRVEDIFYGTTYGDDTFRESLTIVEGCEDAPEVAIEKLADSYTNTEVIPVTAQVTAAPGCSVDAVTVSFNEEEVSMTDLGNGSYGANLDASAVVLTESPQAVTIDVTGRSATFENTDSASTAVVDVVEPTLPETMSVSSDSSSGNPDNLVTTTTTFTVYDVEDVGVGVADVCATLDGGSYCHPMSYDSGDNSWSLSLTGDYLTAPETLVSVVATDGAGNESDPLEQTVEVDDITGISLSSLVVDPSSVNDYEWGNVTITVVASDIQDATEDLTVRCNIGADMIPLAYNGTTFEATFDPSSITPSVGTYTVSCGAQDLDGHEAVRSESFEVLDCDTTASAQNWYNDSDGDGYHDLSSVVTSCESPGATYSTSPSTDTDCDDTDADTYPGADEYCNSTDNDCDGTVDNDAVDMTVWYDDSGDSDGYGDDGTATSACTSPGASYVTVGGDCDTTDADTNPGADEYCNDTDNDCDGTVDNDALDMTTWYDDSGDGDGYGDSGTYTIACDAPSDHVDLGGDCDTSDSSVFPGAPETCADSTDSDCDGYDNTSSAGEICLDAIAAGEVSGLEMWGDSNGDSAGKSVAGCVDYIFVGGHQDDAGGSNAGAIWGIDATETGTMDLADAIAKVIGGDGSDSFGTDVACADIDGDGVADLIGAAPYTDHTSSNDGSAYVLLGPLSGTIDVSTADITLDGSDNFAYRIAVGDLDGSANVDDFAAAARYNDDAAENAGAIFVYHGLNTSSNSVVGTWTGVSSNDEAAEDLAIVEDTDGDGLAELLVGVKNADSVHLVYGPATGSGSLGDSSNATWTATSGTELGAAVSTAGDHDGDGLADLLMGAPSDDSAATDAGIVYLVVGPTTGSATAGSAAYATVSGVDTSDEAGSGVTAGDYDGDGWYDLAIGVPGDDSNVTNGGMIAIHYGPISGSISIGDADQVLYGVGSEDNLSALPSAPFDADSDGLDDLLGAAQGNDDNGSNAGAAYLLLGAELN